ncbi:MAG: nucleoside triphosphate pyrophosphohydrolase [Clostridiales bacterium]|nr:nucleoside triphosphate pyrophosphohydrolase [Clostridiales bacterium]
MIDSWKKEHYDFYDLVKVLELLRSENGCPWDKEQTHESIRRNFIEEVYEAIEAIDEKNTSLLCEELGDVLLQVVFHTEIEKENGRFDINDVTDGICKKLILRHPHIFGDINVKDTDEVLKNWDEIKKKEKGHKSYSDTLESVSKSLPALIRAEKIQHKAAKSGFDWPEINGAFAKLFEEISELKQEITLSGNILDELGDVLFSVVNIARFLKVDPEEALTRTCEKFIKRFRYIEECAGRSGKKFDELSLEEMDKLWNEMKDIETGGVERPGFNN